MTDCFCSRRVEEVRERGKKNPRGLISSVVAGGILAAGAAVQRHQLALVGWRWCGFAGAAGVVVPVRSAPSGLTVLPGG